MDHRLWLVQDHRRRMSRHNRMPRLRSLRTRRVGYRPGRRSWRILRLLPAVHVGTTCWPQSGCGRPPAGRAAPRMSSRPPNRTRQGTTRPRGRPVRHNQAADTDHIGLRIRQPREGAPTSPRRRPRRRRGRQQPPHWLPRARCCAPPIARGCTGSSAPGRRGAPRPPVRAARRGGRRRRSPREPARHCRRTEPTARHSSSSATGCRCRSPRKRPSGSRRTQPFKLAIVDDRTVGGGEGEQATPVHRVDDAAALWGEAFA